METFGIGYIDINACSELIIAGRGGGAEKDVIVARTEILLDQHYLEELAAVMLRLLPDEELSAHRLLGNGGRRVEQKLRWEKVGRG